jgi:o-succinylbenzoate---CoA ligase
VVRTLLALDLPLGPELEAAIRSCVERAEAFSVLDQRLSQRRQAEQLDLLGVTSVLDVSGVSDRPQGRLVDDDVGLVMLTSGSSGPAKAAQLSWDALRASADLTQSTLRAESPPVWFPVLPACHIGGLAVLLRAILSDASLLWDSEANLERAPARGATHVSLVATQLNRYDVSGFYRVLVGGARAPIERGPNVVTTWGMTETGSGVVYDGVALPGVEVAAVNGELCLRSPTLFRSYRNAPRPTVAGPDGRDDWFPTGDAGEVAKGRVRVFGRLAFVINTGGEKLWPEDLERALGTVDGVRDVAVTGVDDPEWGQRVVALVVSDTERDDELRAHAEERIGPWAKPKEIRYVTAIPRTANGKIRRSDLTDLH